MVLLHRRRAKGGEGKRERESGCLVEKDGFGEYKVVEKYGNWRRGEWEGRPGAQ